MKIKINKDKCLGCGTCVALMPEVFEIDAEGKSMVKTSEGLELEQVLMTAKSCPTGAIEVYDDNEQKLWPQN
ncbi:MAG TPA: ferredoxin [Patescibacteria group bacterium]|nr:ferredoxin [Patescibacteria group bacterium]